MTDRRPVKVYDRFLELLDQQLGEHRGPNGEPSATDFLLVDLPPIADLFATGFEQLMTPIPGEALMEPDFLCMRLPSPCWAASVDGTFYGLRHIGA